MKRSGILFLFIVLFMLCGMYVCEIYAQNARKPMFVFVMAKTLFAGYDDDTWETIHNAQENIISLSWFRNGEDILYSTLENRMFIINSTGTDNREISVPGNCKEPDISPDGTKIVFSSRDPGNNEIYICNADGTNPVRLTETDYDELGPKWSPDGTKIAYTIKDMNKLMVGVVNQNGKNLKIIANVRDDMSREFRFPTWSPDGKIVAFDANKTVYLADTSKGGAVKFSKGYLRPSWSPDGEKFICIGKSLFLIDVKTGLREELCDGKNAEYAVFNPAYAK